MVIRGTTIAGNALSEIHSTGREGMRLNQSHGRIAVVARHEATTRLHQPRGKEGQPVGNKEWMGPRHTAPSGNDPAARLHQPIGMPQ